MLFDAILTKSQPTLSQLANSHYLPLVVVEFAVQELELYVNDEVLAPDGRDGTFS